MRFEFLPRGSRQVFDVLQTLYRSYDTTRFYRATKTRQLMQNPLLPDEFIERRFRDVTLESPLSQKPTPGQLSLTNLRLIWSGSAPGLNLLVPYLDVSEIAQNPAGPGEFVRLVTGAPDGRGLWTLVLRPFTVSAAELLAAIRASLERARASPNFGVEVVGRAGDGREDAEVENPRGSAVSGLNSLEVAWDPRVDAALERVVLAGASESSARVELDEELGVAFEVVEGFDRHAFE